MGSPPHNIRTIGPIVPKHIKLNNEQQEVLNAVNSGESMFLTGNAGTGKSTVVRKFCQNTKGLAVVAPTGVAALNIGGQTIHSFFRLGFGIQDPSELKGIKGPQAKVIAAAKIILIDEISMVRSDLLQAIDARLRFSGAKTEPFGGKQVIMVGDFAQLPPVVKNDEVQYLNDIYNGPYAFDSPCWNNLATHTLNQVMRTSDRQFLSALNFIRQGDPQGLDIINDRVQEPPDDAVKLTPTNAAANAINEARLKAVKGQLFTYEASLEGKVPTAPAEENLKLKKGARVVVIANIYQEEEGLVAANGDTGDVVEIDDTSIKVKIDRTGETVKITRHTWESIAYTWANEKLEKEVVGKFEQYPLRLGWAITIHKSQGMTIPKVCLDLRGGSCFAHGQLYVALSRATGLDGLWLTKAISRRNLIVDQRVTMFLGQDV
jgi:ATP-dependent DNA helicase PIF1